MKRWRHKYSPAARRGREAARQTHGPRRIQRLGGRATGTDAARRRGCRREAVAPITHTASASEPPGGFLGADALEQLGRRTSMPMSMRCAAAHRWIESNGFSSSSRPTKRATAASNTTRARSGTSVTAFSRPSPSSWSVGRGETSCRALPATLATNTTVANPQKESQRRCLCHATRSPDPSTRSPRMPPTGH